MANEMNYSHIDQSWLRADPVQTVLALLSQSGEEARVNGGAVRNALMGHPIGDVDISTTLEPAQAAQILQEAGHKVIPTGIDHGTITAVIAGQAFEITTLRQDIKTDGRHAQVVFGRDWLADAKRRDLTINALYVDAGGTVYDPLDGVEDVMSKTVRFIDDAETRIREDYLRILRFFRFFAWYGAFRPDAEGLKACSRQKDNLSSLSPERVWQELSKLLAAPDPGRAILWMRQTGVLTSILPESEKWGIDFLPGLVSAESDNGWSQDSILRLMSIIAPNRDSVETLCKRLRVSNLVRNRLETWAATAVPDVSLSKGEFHKWLYRNDITAVSDCLKLAIARADDSLGKYKRQLKWLDGWEKPQFPLRGQDLLDLGMAPGPQIAARLDEVQNRWIDSGFKLSKDDLLNR